MNKKMKYFSTIIAALALATACQPGVTKSSGRKPHVVCTTNILADMVQNLGGDSLRVTALMGPGVDPHLYKATQGDVQALTQADLIVYNGLHLEGKMIEILEKMRGNKTVEAAHFLDTALLINSSAFPGAYDPHIWFDPLLWSKVTHGLSQHLQKRYPKAASHISANERRFQRQLQQLQLYSDSLLGTIPDNQRVLITAHDAFAYFGRSFDLEVKALQGISTAAEYGINDVNQLVDFITEQGIPAIFVENSVPPRSIEAVLAACRQKEHEVALGGELYSDALGAKNSEAGTYLGMLQHNVETIAKALQ